MGEEADLLQAYSVTKAAQIHLIKGLALAAGPKVRVNTVSPGLMLTVRSQYIVRSNLSARALITSFRNGDASSPSKRKSESSRLRP